MLPALAVAVLVAAAGPSAPGEDLRAELDAVAVRIEQLKARRQAGEDVGDELERLLVRARAIAASLERRASPAPPSSPGPSPDELRERADALRDEADRSAASAARLERELAEAVRAARVEAGLASLISESDLFGEGGMTRVGGRAAPATSGAAPPTSGPGGTGDGTTGSGTPTTASTLAPSGGGGRGDALPGDPAARVRALRAARAGAIARAAALRAEADALEAKARALDAER